MLGKKEEVYFVRENPTRDYSLQGCCPSCAQGMPCVSHTVSNNTLTAMGALGANQDLETYGQKAASAYAKAQAGNAVSSSLSAAGTAVATGGASTGITTFFSTLVSATNLYALAISIAIILLLGGDEEDIADAVGGEFDDYTKDFLNEMPDIDLPDVDIPRLPSLPSGDGFPDITAPEGGGIDIEVDQEQIEDFIEDIDWEQVAKNWDCLKDPVQVIVAGIEKKAMCQKKVTRADGSVGWDYMLEDGSVVQGNRSLKTAWTGIALGAGGLLLLFVGLGGKKKERV